MERTTPAEGGPGGDRAAGHRREEEERGPQPQEEDQQQRPPAGLAAPAAPLAIRPPGDDEQEGGEAPALAERRLARSTLEAVGARAAGLTDSIRSSSSVLRFGLSTVGLLMSPVSSLSQRTWHSYGSPLLSQIDQKLDRCIDAIQEQQRLDEEAAAAAAAAAPGAASARRPRSMSESLGGGEAPSGAAGDLELEVRHRQAETSRLVFWDQLKARFMSSRWFSRVDEVLRQNAVYAAVDQRVMRPAEAFFNTATEAFIAGGESFDSFIEGVQERMGPDWDRRLATPAAAFYHTSVAVKQIVGGAKFFGGAMQLGKQKLNSAIDELIERWDGFLVGTQDRMDAVLPDLEGGAPTAAAAAAALAATAAATPAGESRGEDAAGSDSDSDSDDDDDDDEPLFDMDMEEQPAAAAAAAVAAASSSSDEAAAVSSPRSRKRGREGSPGVAPLVHAATKRLRQRLPLLREMPAQLRGKLVQSTWFVQADAILRDNSMVRMMQEQLRTAVSVAVRPAEHFYNTSVVSFRSNASSAGAFLCDLRARMGTAWDERLRPLAVSFFTSAASAEPAHAQRQPEPLAVQ